MMQRFAKLRQSNKKNYDDFEYVTFRMVCYLFDQKKMRFERINQNL